MGLFSGVGNAKGNSVTYIGSGQYLMRIERCHIVETRKKKDLVAVDLTVIKILADGSAHKIGEEVNWGIQSDSDFFEREIKNFLVAVAGFDPSDMSEEQAAAEAERMCSEIFSAENPLGGVVVELHATDRVSKEGNDYTLRKFVRSLSSAEALAELSDEARNRFFPNGQLEKLAEAEAAAAG